MEQNRMHKLAVEGKSNRVHPRKGWSKGVKQALSAMSLSIQQVYVSKLDPSEWKQVVFMMCYWECKKGNIYEGIQRKLVSQT